MVRIRDGQFSHREQWAKKLQHCLDCLEPDDRRQVLETKGVQDIQNELEEIRKRSSSLPEMEALSTFSSSLSHLRTFGSYLDDNSGSHIDTSSLWGMLYLILKLSEDIETGTTRFARMLKVIGHRVELFNEYCKTAPATERIPEVTFETNVLLLMFYMETINFYRTRSTTDSHESYWNPLQVTFDETIREIDDMFNRMEKLAQLAKESSRVDEVARLQSFLSITPDLFKDDAKLPCIAIPPSRFAQSRSFNRTEAIKSMEAHFQRGGESFSSVALYGLGGVGKSHIALKYAYTHIKDYDAILWVYCETRAAIEQSFTDLAVRLQIRNVAPGNHTENRIQVLTWLQQTKCRWLILFDNAEGLDLLLTYWPVASHGHAIITTRNHSLAFEPADIGLEVSSFEADDGSKLLLHLLSTDISKDLNAEESRSALELSERLSGHALAISHIAGLIHRRSWTIEQFLPIYLKSTQRLHHGALDAVWRLSFESLDPLSSSFLGVLSYVAADSIPQTLFEPPDALRLPQSMQFCADEFSFSEVLEILLTLALVKRDKDTRELSLHRLVQTQFQAFMEAQGRQRAFWDAASLLLKVFPHSGGRFGQLYAQWSQCRLYLQHVLSLAKHYREQRTAAQGLRANQSFCWLLAYCSRYLIETVALGELADLTDLAIEAYAALEPDEKDLYLKGLIENQYAFMWFLQGRYDLSEKYFKSAYDLHILISPPDLRAVAWRSYNMGLVTTARRNFDDGVRWFSAAEKIWQDSGDDTQSCLGCLRTQLGQACFYQGRLDEARACLDDAETKLKDCHEFGWVAFVYFAQGNLYRELSQMKAAEEKYKGAQSAWMANDQTKMHNFYAACLFKLGCVSLEQGDYLSAQSLLSRARTVAKLQEHCIQADYKRIMNKITELDQYISPEQRTISGEELAPYVTKNFADLTEKSWKEREELLNASVHVNWR